MTERTKGDPNFRVNGLVPLVLALVALALGAGIIGYLIGGRSTGGTRSSGGASKGMEASGEAGLGALPLIQAGVADPKVEKSYIRNGVSDRIMTTKRREQFGNCYRTFLAARDESGNKETPEEGKIAVVFHIGENGVMQSYEVIDNELGNEDLEECLTAQLEDLRFLPPPVGINRFIVYDFWFKKDETVRKEIEERNSRPALELVPMTPEPQPGSSE